MTQRNPTCTICKATSSLMWHKTPSGSFICVECQTAEKKSNSSSPRSTRSTSVQSDSTPQPEKSTLSQSPGPVTRRSTRSRERANRAKQQQTEPTNPGSVTVGNGPPGSMKESTGSVVVLSVQASMGNKDTKPPVKCDNPKVPVIRDKDPASSTLNIQPNTSLPALTSYRDHHINQWQRGRRSLSFKLFQPTKLPISQPEIVTSDSMSHKVDHVLQLDGQLVIKVISLSLINLLSSLFNYISSESLSLF